MNVFIRAIVRIFSFGERLIVPFNSAIAPLLNGTINLSPHENILPIALINIHYLYNGQFAQRTKSFTARKRILRLVELHSSAAKCRKIRKI